MFLQIYAEDRYNEKKPPEIELATNIDDVFTFYEYADL